MTQVGNVYGEALYDLARSEALEEEILQQMEALDEAFRSEPGYLRLLAAPNLTKEERCGIVDDSFRSKLHPYLVNFLKILTEKGYSRHFADCFVSYREHYYLDHDIIPVNAVTAVPLSELQRQKLTDKLATLTGKTILLANRVDPGVLGGIRLDYDGKRVDGTVSHRLDAVRGMLKNTVL